MADKQAEYVLGFDLGGTKMLAAVFDRDYKILGRAKNKTRAEEGADAVFKRIVKTIDQALTAAKMDKKKIAGIGVGSPGPLDCVKGIILDTPNIGFRNFPLKEKLENEWKMPVRVDNDVNMGTWGEYHFGAGRGFQHVVGVFPGTGIGGGLILDGKLFRGATGGAGEVGHMIIQAGGGPICGCGQRGCMEAFSSRLSVAKEAAVMAMRGGAPSIENEAGADVKKIKSKVLARAYAAGDKTVVKLIDESAEYLGVGLANLVNILSPELIVLGGGLVEALPDAYLAVARKSMREHAMPWLVKNVKIMEAVCGDDAVILGAAKLIRDAINHAA